MANVTIGDLTAASTVSRDDLIEIEHDNNGTGESKSATLGQIADLLGKEVSGTLTAGSTSITLSDAGITANSTFDFYTSVFGVNPTAAAVANGSITLTFEARTADLDVKVRFS